MKTVGEYSYDHTSELGEGVFGKVFPGHHIQNENDKVAVKIINLRRSVVARTPSEIMGREVTILTDLQRTSHKNLVSLRAHEKYDSKILVMEFCNGGNLFTYLQDLGTLRESVIRHFFGQIGEGLQFLHGRDIVHRDLKPENILLNFDGESYPEPKLITIKIADFGLGRYLPKDGTKLTHCGTPNYMAPEIETGDYGIKVDLWSIGVMIYECLAGTDTARDLKKLDTAKSSQEMRDLLQGLLKNNPEDRLNCDQLLTHNFMAENMHVSVQGDGRNQLHIQIHKDASADELFERVSARLGPGYDKETMFLSGHGTPMSYGSGIRLEDAGIENNSIVVFGHRQSGGMFYGCHRKSNQDDHHIKPGKRRDPGVLSRKSTRRQNRSKLLRKLSLYCL